jgi:hypothetical protein
VHEYLSLKRLDITFAISAIQEWVLHFRLQNVFVIGKGTKAYISLPKGKGVKLTVAEERDRRLAKKK